MDQFIQSPGKNWFYSNDLIINGTGNNMKVKEHKYSIENINLDLLPSMTRFEIDNLYHKRKTEIIFLNNVLNVCEFYGISHNDLERYIELKAGYIPGWIKTYSENLQDRKKYIHYDTMRIKAAAIDELIGLNTGCTFNLMVPSVLYYNFGLLYSLGEIVYFTPEHYKAEITRALSRVKVACIDLHAKSEYCKSKPMTSNKTKIIFKRVYMPSEQV